MNKKTLWLNLRNYNFEHITPPQLLDEVREMFGGEKASKRAFRRKVARKLNWTDEFTKRAVNEYLKFVYLGVTADFVVTPSKIIDQVWHEHILFTRAYRDFCKEVIRYDFDHNPELIPMQDITDIFNAQYLDTLDLYKKEFGIIPPAEIWSKPKFDPGMVSANSYEAHKKRKDSSSDSYAYTSDTTPLYMYVDPGQSNNAYPEFNGFGGGKFGGAGASSNWNENNSHEISAHSASSHSYTDTTNVDAPGESGGHGGDSGGGDSGGSSCSSGCGGGGGD